MWQLFLRIFVGKLKNKNSINLQPILLVVAFPQCLLWSGVEVVGQLGKLVVTALPFSWIVRWGLPLVSQYLTKPYWACCQMVCVESVSFVDGVFPSGCCLCSTASHCWTYPRLPIGAHFCTFCLIIVAKSEFAFDAFFKSLLIETTPFRVFVERNLSLKLVRNVVMAITFSTQSRTAMMAVISWSKAVRRPTWLLGRAQDGLVKGGIRLKEICNYNDKRYVITTIPLPNLWERVDCWRFKWASSSMNVLWFKIWTICKIYNWPYH